MHGVYGGRGPRFSLMGVAFVVVGVWWLLSKLGYLDFSWSWAGPLALIFVGLSLLFRGWGCAWGWRSHDAPPNTRAEWGQRPPQ